MANANCKFWQSQLYEQQKNLDKYKASGKLPVGVVLSPYVTFDSFIKSKEESIAKLKKDILSNDCANDQEAKKFIRDKCLALNQRINNYTSEISSDYMRYLNNPYRYSFNINVWNAENLKKPLEEAKADFKYYNCISEIEASRQEVVGGIISEYSDYDKKRIEAESIYQRNQRIFFGGVVLIFGIALIMGFKKSKK